MAWRQLRRPHVRIPFFRIFYSTTYTSLFFILLVLLGITPATIIYDSIANSAYQYMFMVGGAYILVAALTLLLYSSRLYSNRSVLAGVGKSYIPVEDGEVSRNVRKEIVKGLRHSALVAAATRPRDLRASAFAAPGIDPTRPPWGTIERPGWSAPESASGHVYYDSVVRELPNLIEARLVDLGHETRSAGHGLREYLEGFDAAPPNADTFLALYERARFDPPLTTASFDTLMNEFARFLEELQTSRLSSLRSVIKAEPNSALS